jgi:dynein heavy chain
MFLKDSKITDAANESRDNVKYLYTLDKFFSSLTKASPVSFFLGGRIVLD